MGHHFLSVLWVFPCPKTQPASLMGPLCCNCCPSEPRQLAGLGSSDLSQLLRSRATSDIPTMNGIGSRILLTTPCRYFYCCDRQALSY